MKFLAFVSILLFLVGCQTTVAEYNLPKSFTNSSNPVEVWMNDDGLNSAVLININGEESWQRKSIQGAAMSVLLPSGKNYLAMRMVYQEFMAFPVDQILNIELALDPNFKYVFVSKYDKNEKSFSYRFEKIDKGAICAYDSANVKRIITGELICSRSGSVYKFR